MTEREAVQKLSEMLPRLYAWAVELDKIEEPSPEDRTKPFPPAAEADIVAAEKRLRFKFPPSYRGFLKLHNGWKNFSFDWWVLGVSGRGTAAAEKEWKREAGAFEKRCRKMGATYIETLRTQSKTDAAVMYWPDHPPCAVDFNGGFMLFDRNRPLGEGEYEIAEIGRDDEVARRLPHFLSFVEWAMKIARRELQIHGRDPDAIPPMQPSVADAARKIVKATPRTAVKDSKKSRRSGASTKGMRRR